MRNEKIIQQFPKKLPGTFWGITSYFNPAKYKNKIENYRKFRESSKKQGLNLISVELAFGNEPFELTKKDADILIQVRSNSILWQKERLLNIGLKHLPKDCDKVAWLDCDILFMNNNWIQESSSLLEKYKVIQLFSFLIRDSKKSIKDFFKIPFGRIDGQKYEGFSYGLINSCEASKQTNPGGAWAARKEDLVKCKFYDRFILNSGDVLQALMFFNEPFSKIFDGLLNINIKKDISSWMKNSKMIKKSVYYLDNIGVHLWHGDMKNRQYYQKADILKKYNFDPNKDIKLNKDECWEWATDKTGLHNEFKLLFGDRLEDREGLTKMLEKAKKNKREDISVIIPVRNREAFRLSNVIKSIRNQDYPGGLIQIYVVDYGSNEDYSTQYKTICNKNNIRMIHVSNNLRWNKSHALNIAIKEVKTKYLLISDVDILFEENYISTVINEIKKDLYQVVLCRPLDSPREIDFSNKDITKSYNLIKSMCKYRGSKKESNYLYGTGIAFSLTLFFKWIRGYDENYLIWGAEDDDLIKRFNLLGLKTTYITDKSSYIHQWHEKYANLEQEKKEIRDQIKINKYYYHNNNSIIRNIQGYGKY